MGWVRDDILPLVVVGSRDINMMQPLFVAPQAYSVNGVRVDGHENVHHVREWNKQW